MKVHRKVEQEEYRPGQQKFSIVMETKHSKVCFLMPVNQDKKYLNILLSPLAECVHYKPAFGKAEPEGIDLNGFKKIYGQDPLYHWIGLDSELMYAAHKAAGGMTSIYRQFGIGCERLLRQIIQDSLSLSEKQVAWSYDYER
ncbi:MAG: hypothetical protein JSR44_13745 [Spirochaetes bacterium]|nr:hypothetical protein [Spirochaetota bacterium]